MGRSIGGAPSWSALTISVIAIPKSRRRRLRCRVAVPRHRSHLIPLVVASLTPIGRVPRRSVLRKSMADTLGRYLPMLPSPTAIALRNAGFPLRVVPVQHCQARIEEQIEMRNCPIIFDSNLFQPHEWHFPRVFAGWWSIRLHQAMVCNAYSHIEPVVRLLPDASAFCLPWFRAGLGRPFNCDVTGCERKYTP